MEHGDKSGAWRRGRRAGGQEGRRRAHDIALGDGAVHVRDDDLAVARPAAEGSEAERSADEEGEAGQRQFLRAGYNGDASVQCWALRAPPG